MIIFLVLGILAVSILWNVYYKRRWAQHITVRLWFGADAVYAGQETKLYEVIENRKRMPVPVLEVGFHAKKELDFTGIENTNVSDYIYKRDVFAVLGMQRITREIPVKCKKRGKYAVSDADLTTYTLLYRKRYSEGIETDAGIYVYPEMTDVSEIVTICERMLGILQCSKRMYEDPFAFRTIRAYTTDDPMKTINWKASAKTGTLMVNTFDSVLSQKAMVFLDVEDTGILKYEDLVEAGISISASIARRLLRRNIEVGFAYNGNRKRENGNNENYRFLPTNKKSSLVMLERELAEYHAENGACSFALFLDVMFGDVLLTEDTLLIMITKNLDRELFDRIKGYAGDYQTLIVVPVYRGEAGNKRFEEDGIISRNNIRVLIREVDRA